MDKLLDETGIVFGDLRLDLDRGFARQMDPKPFEYGQEYYANYVERNTSPIALDLNRERVALVKRYADSVLDMGIGSGQFIESFEAAEGEAFGYDVNPVANEWLKGSNRFYDPYDCSPPRAIGWPTHPFKAWTYWDTLEHLAHPTEALRLVTHSQFVFVSLPVFHDLTRVMQSKHFKPNEHRTYFSPAGLIEYFKALNFYLLEISDIETRLGRDNVLSFVFIRY